MKIQSFVWALLAVLAMWALLEGVDWKRRWDMWDQLQQVKEQLEAARANTNKKIIGCVGDKVEECRRQIESIKNSEPYVNNQALWRDLQSAQENRKRYSRQDHSNCDIQPLIDRFQITKNQLSRNLTSVKLRLQSLYHKAAKTHPQLLSLFPHTPL